jgi:hypothetical protein
MLFFVIGASDVGLISSIVVVAFVSLVLSLNG